MGLVEIAGKVGRDRGRAEQALLLAGEGHEDEGGVVFVAGEDAGEFEDDTGLRASIVSRGGIGGVVENIGGTRVVVAADDYQAIGMASGQPCDDVVGRRCGAAGMHERIEPHLESGDRAVLGEEIVARGGDALIRSGNTGTGLPGAEILQGLRGIEDVIGIDVGEYGADL